MLECHNPHKLAAHLEINEVCTESNLSVERVTCRELPRYTWETKHSLGCVSFGSQKLLCTPICGTPQAFYHTCLQGPYYSSRVCYLSLLVDLTAGCGAELNTECNPPEISLSLETVDVAHHIEPHTWDRTEDRCSRTPLCLLPLHRHLLLMGQEGNIRVQCCLWGMSSGPRWWCWLLFPSICYSWKSCGGMSQLRTNYVAAPSDACAKEGLGELCQESLSS